MALFRRKKTGTVSDLEEYYASKKNRPAMAWFMAFISLLITIAVLAAIFFGGRLIYRTLTDDENVNDTDISQNDSQPGSVNSDGTVNQGSNNQESSNNAEENNSNNSDNDADFPSVVTDEAASTDEPNNVTGSEDEDLPNTGIDSYTLLLPLITLLAGYFTALKYQSRSK